MIIGRVIIGRVMAEPAWRWGYGWNRPMPTSSADHIPPAPAGVGT